MADIIKTIEQVYPELNSNSKIKNPSVKKFLIKYNEAFIVAIIIVLFIAFLTLQEGSDFERLTFRIINEISSVSITIMSVLNLFQLRHLYFDSKYYGTPFVCLDFLSGPFCLLLDIISLLIGKNLLGLYYADAFRMLKFFTYEKLRIIIKDIFFVMPRAKKVFFSMMFVFFIFSLIGFKLFSVVNPEQFRNMFISLLSIFQVLTFDCWNLQVNLPIIKQWGSYWSFYFIIAIFLLQFFYFNFFLSEFVTYYSNRSYRVNFVYKYSQDEKNNPRLKEKIKKQINVKEVLKLLGIEKDQKHSSGLQYILSYYKYIYVFSILFIEILRFLFNPIAVIYLQEIFFGLLMMADFYINLKEMRSLNGESSVLVIMSQNSKTLILFLSGFLGFATDLIAFAFGDFSLCYGSCVRILILLTTDECQFSFIKLKQVFSKIGEMGMVNLMIIYILSIIGYYCLYRFNNLFGFYFEDVTNSYLFLLQTITFDAWGDIARAAMLIFLFINQFLNPEKKNPIYAIYFAFMIIFMGFLLQNFLVGTIATTVQPATEDEFEKSRVLQRRMPKYFVNILREYLGNPQQKYQQKQIKNDDPQTPKNIRNFQELLEEFNKGNSSLTVNLEGKEYTLKTKNIISLEN